MLVANYFANNDIRLEERPIPLPGDQECLIKIKASGICGSDLMEWYRLDSVPVVLGHEIAGEIVETGSQPASFQVGDRVVALHHVPCLKCRHCRRGHETLCSTLRTTHFDPGGFSQYVRLPQINTRLGLFPIPKTLTYDEASFAEPLACVIRGQNRVNLQSGDSVAIIGSGISGILHIALAKAQGAECIIATDINPYRLSQAKKFGADLIVDDAHALPETLLRSIGRKADIVIITTGHPDAIQAGFDVADEGAAVLLFAPSTPGISIPVSVNDFFFKHDRILTTTYANTPDDLRQALHLLSRKEIPVADMITHRLPLQEIQTGFNLALSKQGVLKVIIRPNDEADN